MPQIFDSTEIEYHFEDTVSPSYGLRKERDILKLKNNIIKEKCNKLLKNKLKKYKLRKDGTEDPDIIDVSKSFFLSLKIKSPNNGHKHSSSVETDNQNVKNYLFKMGKHIITNKNKVQKKEAVPQDINNSFIENKTNCDNVQLEVTEKLDMEIKLEHKNKNVNAFDLLMSSRSKSLGSNSPGKDKSINQFETEDIMSRNQLKLKRKSILEKMAEAKGRLDNMETEKCKDECIKRKMDKRAKRFKKILSKGESKWNEKNTDNIIKKYKNNKTKTPLSKTRENNSNREDNSKIDHTLTPQPLSIVGSRSPSPCSIFVINDELQEDITISKLQNKIQFQQVEHDYHHNNKVVKFLSNEDEEFLKKLSPSIRKQENVLCYFPKIEKNLNTIEDNSEDLEESKNNLIKVKLTSLYKNSTKRDKTKNNNIDQSKVDKNSEIENTLDLVNVSFDLKHAHLQNLPSNQNSAEPSRKRKRKKNEVSVDCEMNPIEPMVAETRPQRNIKKPVKYTEEYKVSSSDEELHIFTPKKKKNVYENCSGYNTNGDKKQKQQDDVTLQTKSKSKHKVAPLNKKDGKTKVNIVTKSIAPIFLKSQVDSVAIEAKQKFLHSGMPEQIKKIASKQNSINAVSNIFPLTRHVQQQEAVSLINEVHTLHLLPIEKDDTALLEFKIDFKHLLNLNSSKFINNGFTNNVQKTLESIKQEYPKFPVYRTFHSLKNKKSFQYQDLDSNCLDNSSEVLNNIALDKSDGPKSLNWSEKYRATTTKDIIGNFEPIKELKKWLMTWKENEVVKKSVNVDSDTSDFCYSDDDSTDNMRSINNLLIITGAVGSGKTSSVYAVASELAMKVIEVNASSKRTGKIMFQDLQEATQSHKVNRAKASNSDNSQNSQEIVVDISQKKRKKKNSLSRKSSLRCVSISQNDSQYSSQGSQTENAPTIMSLILIDDADIVFEQDDGFASALAQIVHCSKRPVIIVATTLTSPHLQKYLPFGNIVKMNRLMPRMLGTWLDILCLADCGECCPGLGAKLLEYFRGDIRKTINSLQFLVSSQSSLNKRELDADSQRSDDGNVKTFNAEEDSSNISWAHSDYENQEKMICNSYHNLKYLFKPQTSFLDIIQLSDLTTKASAWWNQPMLSNSNVATSSEEKKSKDNLKENISELTAMADAIDSISLSDMICHQTQPDSKDHIASHPWFTTETNSVSDKENMENYNRHRELGHEICFEYVKNSIEQAQCSVGEMFNTHIPGMMVQREKERIVDRHHALTSSVSPCAVLDRRSLATDYWATCRTICRIEKGKVDNNTKRRHRYCHYLKTQKVMCKNDSFDKLCDSLSCSDKTK